MIVREVIPGEKYILGESMEVTATQLLALVDLMNERIEIVGPTLFPDGISAMLGQITLG